MLSKLPTEVFISAPLYFFPHNNLIHVTLILTMKQHVKSRITAHLDKWNWAHPASHSCCDISTIDRVISRPSVGRELGGLSPFSTVTAPC